MIFQFFTKKYFRINPRPDHKNSILFLKLTQKIKKIRKLDIFLSQTPSMEHDILHELRQKASCTQDEICQVAKIERVVRGRLEPRIGTVPKKFVNIFFEICER